MARTKRTSAQIAERKRQADHVRELLKASGVSQAQVARRMDLEPSRVSNALRLSFTRSELWWLWCLKAVMECIAEAAQCPK